MWFYAQLLQIKTWTVSNARGEPNNVEGIDLLIQDYDGDMVEKYAFRLAWPHFGAQMIHSQQICLLKIIWFLGCVWVDKNKTQF